MVDSGEPAANTANEPATEGHPLDAFEGELGRRLVHVSGAAIPICYYITVVYDIRWLGLSLFVAGFLLAVCLEVARLHFGVRWWPFEHLTREYEEETVAGYAMYATSVTIVAFVFEPAIAVPSMLMLAIGDPLSGSLSDQRVKGPQVTIPTFVVCFLLALPFLAPIVAAAAATAATVADAVLLSSHGIVLDDNLTIPLAAASAAWLVRELPALLTAVGML
jgi:dolichol kinase